LNREAPLGSLLSCEASGLLWAHQALPSSLPLARQLTPLRRGAGSQCELPGQAVRGGAVPGSTRVVYTDLLAFPGLLTVKYDGYRPVVDQGHIHHRSCGARITRRELLGTPAGTQQAGQ